MQSISPLNLSHSRKIREIKANGYTYIIFIHLETNKIFYQILYNTKLKTTEEEQQFLQNLANITKISTFLIFVHINEYHIHPFPTIITEYHPNGTLLDISNYSPKFGCQQFTGTKKLINLLGISLFIQFIYLNNITYGKLKPSNVHLDEYLYPHIIIYEDLDQINQGEDPIKRNQILSKDIESFALIAYELITGTRQKVPDLTKIKSEWMKKFLQSCLLEDCYEKPKYYLLYKNLLKNRKMYQSLFGEINEDEVNRYIESIENNYLLFVKDIRDRIESDSNDTKAMIIYGNMLYQGSGIDEDKKEAARMFKMAADLGDSEAMFRYGVMASNGHGIERNTKEAAKYYKMAIDLGHPDAMNNYGLLLENGDGVDKDLIEAANYYKKAALLGITISMCNYAIVKKSDNSIITDKKEAAKYFKMAAGYGNRQAIYNYGVMLFDGNGIESDKVEGLKFIKIAADKGYIIAMVKYAIILIQNKEEKKNLNEAVYYLKMAADLGSSNAMFIYAIMLNNGEGVKMDKLEAERYFKMAGYLGHEKAWRIYSLMTHSLNFAF